MTCNASGEKVHLVFLVIIIYQGVPNNATGQRFRHGLPKRQGGYRTVVVHSAPKILHVFVFVLPVKKICCVK